jgi:hypothetical protein
VLGPHVASADLGVAAKVLVEIPPITRAARMCTDANGGVSSSPTTAAEDRAEGSGP